ncbi:magnesium transporter [Halocatena salina]|uniref:Magnesium transporter n=1 Tax=Halocatena salina TaxID=2934340 RepID=A0A8U0A2H1_9EURY|nr:magnesium transporter [Halocatena salina]UPM43046.1 magnesium transporter [Halocatena salina]
MGVRAVAIRAYREGLGALSASTIGSLLAGIVLSGLKAEFRVLPGLLVLVPALLATRGNVYGSLGARIATALHQGLLTPSLFSHAERQRLKSAVVAALASGILTSAFAAIAASVFLWVLSEPAALRALLAVAVLAGLLSGIALSVIVIAVVFVGYRRGYNPDTLVGPAVTTTGDIFGVFFLYLAVKVVLAL